jgi:hypothetical protein
VDGNPPPAAAGHARLAALPVAEPLLLLLPFGRLMVLHTPWALYICERTPLPIRITEQGIARAAELAGESSDPVVPMSHAASA